MRRWVSQSILILLVASSAHAARPLSYEIPEGFVVVDRAGTQHDRGPLLLVAVGAGPSGDAARFEGRIVYEQPPRNNLIELPEDPIRDFVNRETRALTGAGHPVTVYEQSVVVVDGAPSLRLLLESKGRRRLIYRVPAGERWLRLEYTCATADYARLSPSFERAAGATRGAALAPAKRIRADLTPSGIARMVVFLALALALLGWGIYHLRSGRPGRPAPPPGAPGPGGSITTAGR